MTSLSETDLFALHYAARLLDEQAAALHEAGTRDADGAWEDPSDDELHADLTSAASDLRSIALRANES